MKNTFQLPLLLSFLKLIYIHSRCRMILMKKIFTRPVLQGNRGIAFLAIASILVFSSNSAAARVRFTESQVDLLKVAYHYGKQIGYPETIQGILMQETLAGLLGRVGDRRLGFGKKSYGVMQVKLSTAKDVLKKHRGMKEFKEALKYSDEELLARLIMDDAFNILVGTMYFKMHMDRYEKKRRGWSKAVSAYNRGCGCDVTSYATKVRTHIRKRIRPLNKTIAASGFNVDGANEASQGNLIYTNAGERVLEIHF